MQRLSRRKVAVVVPKYGLVGGGERFVYELTERIAQRTDYEIHVLANKWEDSGSSKIIFHTIPIVSFPKWLTTVSFAYFVRRALTRIEPDIIHTHDRIFEADIATVHSIPHALWVREIRKKKMPSLFDLATSWVEKKLYTTSKCRLFMPVSELAAKKVKEFYSLPDTKLQVMPPGIDLERFHRGNDRQSRSIMRQEFGVTSDQILFLFVGMNFELKGLRILMKALGRFKNKAGAGLRLLVVGKGDQKKFQKNADSLGIGGDVIFAGVRHDMENVYQASDVFVLFSGFDTFGMVVTEALASGLPVVVSDQVGAKDLIVQGENGFVVNRDDEQAIDSAFLQIIDHEKRKLMRKQARESVACCSWDKLAEEVVEIYDGLEKPF